MPITVLKHDPGITDAWDAWDRGDHVLSAKEGAIYSLPDGERVGDLMSDWTKCPIHNGTCQDMVVLELYAINPDKGGEPVKVHLCPLGICGNGEKCPLNK